jgi:hypothetical protein
MHLGTNIVLEMADVCMLDPTYKQFKMVSSANNLKSIDGTHVDFLGSFFLHS